MFSVILPFLWLCVASAFVLLAFGHFVSGKPFESDAFILLSLALLPPATAAIAAIAKDAASESWMFSERTKYRYFAAAASGVIVSFFLGQSWFVGVMAFLLTFSFAFRIDARFFFVPAIILVALYPISALSDTGRAAAGGILILAEIATVTGLIRLLVDTIAWSVQFPWLGQWSFKNSWRFPSILSIGIAWTWLVAIWLAMLFEFHLSNWMQSVFGILLLSISAHSLSYAEKMERFIRKYLDAIARTGIAIGAELYYCLTAGFALYLLNVDPTKISELAWLVLFVYILGWLSAISSQGRFSRPFDMHESWRSHIWVIFAGCILVFISAGAILARFSLNQHAWWTLPLSIGSYLACVHLLTHGSRLGLPHIPGIRDMRRRGLGWIAPVLKPDLILSVIGSWLLIWMTFSHQHTASIAMEDFRRDMQQRGFEPAVTRLISQLPTKQPTWAPPPIDLIVLPDIGESSTGSTQESALPDTMESTVDLAETTTPQDTLTTTSEIPPPTIGSMHSFPRLLWFGNTGPDVRELQGILRDAGTYTGTIDGVYSELTGDALAEFIRRHTGIAGFRQLGPMARERLLSLPLPTPFDW